MHRTPFHDSIATFSPVRVSISLTSYGVHDGLKHRVKLSETRLVRPPSHEWSSTPPPTLVSVPEALSFICRSRRGWSMYTRPRNYLFAGATLFAIAAAPIAASAQQTLAPVRVTASVEHADRLAVQA